MLGKLAIILFVAGSATGQITWSDGVADAVKEAARLDRLVFVYVFDSV